jgi:hypothetical protein
VFLHFCFYAFIFPLLKSCHLWKHFAVNPFHATVLLNFPPAQHN